MAGNRGPYQKLTEGAFGGWWGQTVQNSDILQIGAYNKSMDTMNSLATHKQFIYKCVALYYHTAPSLGSYHDLWILILKKGPIN